MRVVAGLAAALLLVGCYGGPLRSPLPLTEIGGPEGETLVVLLHGRGGSPDDFAEKGDFAGPIASSGRRARLVAPDAHLGYYAAGEIVSRLRRDVVLPARERSPADVWIAGVSLGGLGALQYLKEHPDEVRGIVLMAPYLGESRLVDALVRAGAPRGWTRDALSERDLRRVEDAPFQLELWEWLLSEEGLSRHGDRIYLVFGSRDRFASGHRLLAELLPAGHALERPGGHDWRTWESLWSELLASDPRVLAPGP